MRVEKCGRTEKREPGFLGLGKGALGSQHGFTVKVDTLSSKAEDPGLEKLKIQVLRSGPVPKLNSATH